MPLMRPPSSSSSSSDDVVFSIGAVDNTAAGINSAVNNVNKLNQAGGKAEESVGGGIASAATNMEKWAKVAVVTSSVITSAAVAIKKAYVFSEQGAGVVRLTKSFDTVAQSYNSNSASILLSMQKASRGTIKDTDLMLAANRAMLLGVSSNADELGKITEVAIARGRAMGLSSSEAIDRVYTGIGRLSPKILDDLGIITNATQRYEDYAKAHNMSASAIDDFTKREIIKQAILSSSQTLLKDYTDDSLSSYERLKASWANYQDSSKASIAGMFDVPNNAIAGVLQSAANVNQARLAYTTNFEKQGVNPYNDPRFASGRSQTFDPAKYKAAALAFQQAQAMSSAYESKTAREDVATNVGRSKSNPFVQDMEMALEGGIALTDMTQKYSDKTAELTEKLNEEQAALERLHKEGYKDTSAKVQEQTEKVNKLKEAIVKNNANQAKSQKEYALEVLKTTGATNAQQMAFAVASGQITQGAANQELAQQRLADAYKYGQISAITYASAVATLMQKLNKMDGKKAQTFLDIWITTHEITVSGGGVSWGSSGNKPNAAAGDVGLGGDVAVKYTNPDTGMEVVSGKMAGGGVLGNGWNLVGDAPGGGFIAGVSELVKNGRVYSSSESAALIKSGRVSLAKSYAIPSEDVYTNFSTAQTKKIPNFTTVSKAKSGGVGGGANTGGVASFASMAIPQAVAMQVQDMQVQTQTVAAQAVAQIQTMTQQLQASQAAAQDVFEEMLSVLRSENPRAIGKQVAFELAKAT